MKPTKTWIVLADARNLRIAVNDGPGKGIYGQSVSGLKPPPLLELSDAPGMTNAPQGPNRGAIANPDLKGQAEATFATGIVAYLEDALQSASFDRFVLAAAPEMLGLIRQRLPNALADVMIADIPKDLTRVTLDDLPKHLRDILVT